VGWFDGEGDGDFVVALRSALVDDDLALLYAGAGIVRDSDVDAELAETDVKLRTMLDALGGDA
jgi:isochorismate synthase EntC